MKNKDGVSSKRLVYWILAVSIFVAAVVVGAFVLFSKQQSKVKDIYLDSGDLLMTYTTDSNVFNVSNLSPMSDIMGMRSNNAYFDFSVAAHLDNSSEIEYEIAVQKNDGSIIDDKDIRIYLQIQDGGSYVKLFGPSYFTPLSEKSSFGAPANSMILSKVLRKKDTTDNYRLRVWLAEDSSITSDLSSYSLTINVYGHAK